MKLQTRKQRGFTLIEVMVTVAILGVLMSIALPSYTEYVKKGKRTEAKVELLRIAQMQESYFVQNLSYAKDLTQLGFSGNTITTEEGLYSVTMGNVLPASCNPSGSTPAACTSFNITATATGAQSGDSVCTGFRIDNIARKFAAGSGATGYSDAAKARTCW